MSSVEAIGDRVLSNRRDITNDTFLRFGVSGFNLEEPLRGAADRLVDVLAVAFKTGNADIVREWALNERVCSESFPLRELAHAMCMAIGAEVARVFRTSFREAMEILQRIEAAIASAVRENESLQVAA